VAFGSDGAWAVLYNKNEVVFDGLPDGLVDRLQELFDEDEDTSLLALTPDGGWVVIIGDNGFATEGLE
jgi:hypothetical protein